MILLPLSVRIHVAVEPMSMRKSFEGLGNEVRAVIGRDPLSGHVFVFLNRQASQLKLLVWTRGGFTIVHKRLERGTFARVFDAAEERTHVEIDVHELSMLLEGIELSTARTSNRWEPTRHASVT